MMQQEIQNILETFEPLISIYQDGEQKIICFDSNFRNDLNREAKTKTVSTGDKNISFKVGEPVLKETYSDGMQIVEADILISVSGHQSVLHQLNLALPAVSKNEDGSFNHMGLLDIRMILADKIADAASAALENYFGTGGQSSGHPKEDNLRHRAEALNVWRQSDPIPANPTLWSVFGGWKPWKKVAAVLTAGLVSVAVVSAAISLLSAPAATDAATIAQASTSPEAANAQVALTRETLKQMGLDPGKVQSDLGCLAH